MTPYEPKSIGGIPELRALHEQRHAEFYAKHGITTAIVTEPAGFRLAVYKDGAEIPGGLQGIAEAIKQ